MKVKHPMRNTALPPESKVLKTHSLLQSFITFYQVSLLKKTLQVVIYHGNKREASVEELSQADVVLTTYSIVENEFRKNCLPDKVPCSYCNKKFFPDRLKVHLRYCFPFLPYVFAFS